MTEQVPEQILAAKIAQDQTPRTAQIVWCVVTVGGNVRSVYVRIEDVSIPLRDGQGYIYLPPRAEAYDVLYLAKGAQNSTITILLADGLGRPLKKITDTVGPNGRAQGLDSFVLDQTL